MHNVGTVPTCKMHNVWTAPMFKMHNVGTVPMFKNKKIVIFVQNWNLDCMAKTYDRCLCQLFYLSHLGPIIQSSINCMDKKCTVQILPFKKLVFLPRFLLACGLRYSFNFCLLSPN